MSIYYAYADEPPTFLASNVGWGDFGRWVATLPVAGYAALIHLREYGWAQQLGLLAQQLAAALHASKPADATVSATAAAVLSACVGHDGDALVITDGTGPDTDAQQHTEPARFDAPVPPVQQSTPWTCGPAALASVAQRFGIDTDEAAVAQLAGADPDDGTPPEAMVDAAGKLGLDAVAVERMTPAQLSLSVLHGRPVIVCLVAPWLPAQVTPDSGHWVTVVGFDGQDFTYTDPAVAGNQTISTQDLLTRWKDQDSDGRVYTRLGIVVKGRGK